MSKTQKQLFYLAAIATVFAAAVIGIGAYTRLVHAGLGCPDWPGCYGLLTAPVTDMEISQAQVNFPDMQIDSKGGWVEMFHRYFAGTLLLIIMYISFIAWRDRHENLPYKLAFSILCMGALQAAFGMWTVTLKLWPQVVVSHLLGGIIILSLLFLLTLKLYNKQASQTKLSLETYYNLSSLRFISTIVLVLVCLQIALGGWTSANYASLACTDFPTCQGSLFPDMDVTSGFNIFLPLGDNYLGGKLDSTARTAIHMMHRVGALLTTIMILLLVYCTYKKINIFGNFKKNIAGILSIITTVLIIQIILGILNIIAHLPLSIAVSHTVVASILLLSVIAYKFYIYKAADCESIK